MENTAHCLWKTKKQLLWIVLNRLTGKFFIINFIGNNRVLNKRSEFINKCRHQNKYLIKNVKLKDSMD